MRATCAFILVCTFLFSVRSHADTPAPQREYSVASPNGDYQFTMFPQVWENGEMQQAHGVATRVDDGQALWTVSGWYSFETFIADDGRSLVRIGPWASLPVDEELAVAFYRDGDEIRRYFVAELISDPEAVRRTVSHYGWQKREDGYPRLSGDQGFELRTVEDNVVTFTLTNGAILAGGSNLTTTIESPPPGEYTEDQLFAMRRFARNDLELDPATVTRVVRGGQRVVSVIWVDATFEGLPVFHHEVGYRFDGDGRVVRDPQSGTPRTWSKPLPPATAFPIDPNPDIAKDAAASTWLDRVRSERPFYGPDFTPDSAPELVLGYYNIRLGSSGDGEYRLAWRVRPRGEKYPVAYISAKKGDVLRFDSGVRNMGGGVAGPGRGASGPDRSAFVGVWSRLYCDGTYLNRRVTIHNDGSFRAADFIESCTGDAGCANSESVLGSGSWRMRGDGSIRLRWTEEPVDATVPTAFRVNASGDRLRESLAGSAQPCEYMRLNETAVESPTACHAAVQGKLAWDSRGRTRWASANVDRLCRGAEDSTAPAECFREVMNGSVDRGDGTPWMWRSAIDLCAGTTDSTTRIACFEQAIQSGNNRREATAACAAAKAPGS